MKVKIHLIQNPAAEQVIIECVRETKETQDIKNYVLSKGTTLAGTVNQRLYSFNLNEVFYFEAVDERLFAYTESKVYELKHRLYEMENLYSERHFLRCSKSILVNLMRIDYLTPALNGRFTAHLKNKEKIIISRQYVGHLKAALLGGK